MSGISTHVLDTAIGRPARDIGVLLEIETSPGSWKDIARGITDKDGRIANLFAGPLVAGNYRLRFDVDRYFALQRVPSFYPFVNITFHVEDVAQHYHVPLLLSAFGYSTYRGS
jgi:5-hydroxyisourate hydrolase